MHGQQNIKICDYVTCDSILQPGSKRYFSFP